jgi:5-methylcytosine-specific restriction endonuclease McrA
MIEANTVHKTVEAKVAAKREASRKNARANPARLKSLKIAYLSRLSRATPAWLTKEHWDEMNALYFKAREMTKETAIRHEVDHIHPLNGKTVCGLHVPWNLQILTQSENVAKSNIYAELYGDVEK